jgi:hypothetical protein
MELDVLGVSRKLVKHVITYREKKIKKKIIALPTSCQTRKDLFWVPRICGLRIGFHQLDEKKSYFLVLFFYLNNQFYMLIFFVIYFYFLGLTLSKLCKLHITILFKYYKKSYIL